MGKKKSAKLGIKLRGNWEFNKKLKRKKEFFFPLLKQKRQKNEKARVWTPICRTKISIKTMSGTSNHLPHGSPPLLNAVLLTYSLIINVKKKDPKREKKKKIKFLPITPL